MYVYDSYVFNVMYAPFSFLITFLFIFYVYLLLPAVTMIHVLFELDYTNALYVYSPFSFLSILLLFYVYRFVLSFYEKQDGFTKIAFFFYKTKDRRFFLYVINNLVWLLQT